MPTYFTSSRDRKRDFVGAYAGSLLAAEIMNIMDNELYESISNGGESQIAYLYLFPPIVSMQTICRPFEEVIKLWDFMCCFGMHLCPVIIATASIMSKRDDILQETAYPIPPTLSSRNYLKGEINAQCIIEIAMDIICELKQNHQDIWNQLLHHASDIELAIKIKGRR